MATDTRDEDARLLKESLGLVAPVAPNLIADFYEKLFQDFPEVRPLFPEIIEPQREKLLKAVIALVTHYDTPEVLAPALAAMGRNHLRYGTQPGHYDAVAQTLLATLEKYAGAAWTPEVAGAWTRLLTFAATAMQHAAAEHTAAQHEAVQHEVAQHEVAQHEAAHAELAGAQQEALAPVEQRRAA